jgi:hypothetical protein
MAWTSAWGVEKLRFDIIPPIRGHRNMPWERKSADTIVPDSKEWNEVDRSKKPFLF